MQHQEYFFKYKKYKIFAQYWLPDNCKGIILLVHGMGEHSARYEDYLIPELLAKHIAVITYDNFGHGKSSGKRGHCPNYNSLMDVINTVYQKSREIVNKLPVFLYGHSMGGNLVINYLIRKKAEVTGVIITSPFLRLAFQPPKWKITMGRVFQKIVPSMTLPSGLDVKAISRVTDEVEKYKNDPLIHDRVSPNFTLPIIEAGIWAISKATLVEKPVLIVHGTEDQITDYRASQEFAEKNDLISFIPFKGGYHELHNDIKKEKFLLTITNWIGQRV
ncbi:alpha/beta hydrolase [uncultured Aquimarina sp.]|uniref:alpha/beta hydrolase n=1 Tax=uncultured Aquimarina sp. TaxID=575652 RepID=UPI00260FB740|nr:alpha/beta hydrolase [uncultured Aquimarina sp.]